MRESILLHLSKVKMLEAVVGHRSFKLASSELGVTQSAISQSISQLERIFGQALLIRHYGEVCGTEQCLHFLNKISPILHSLKEIDGIIESPSPKRGTLTFGVDESLVACALPKLYQQLKKENPDAKLTIRTGSPGKLCMMVRKGELSMALVRENDLMENLHIYDITSDRLGVYSALEDLNEIEKQEGKVKVLRLSFCEGGHPSYHRRFFKHAETLIADDLTSDSYLALRDLALEGCFSVVIPERLAQTSSCTLHEIKIDDLTVNTSRHSLNLVSRTNCYTLEARYLARLLNSVLESKH